MPRSYTRDELSGSRPVVLILRIMLNRYAELQYCEVLDVQANSVASITTITGLTQALTRWLEQQPREIVCNEVAEDDRYQDPLPPWQ